MEQISVLKQCVNALLHGTGQVVDAIFPPRCIISGAIVGAPGQLDPGAWAGLSFIAPPFCRTCGMPFPFTSEGVDDLQCAACLDDPPPFTAARAAVVYDDASRGVILKFKHADHLHAVPVLVPWIMRAGAELWADADVLVPVPLHRWRLMRRRYNQAALLAHGVAKETCLPCLADGLIRHRATESQGHKRAAERRKNVKGAFAINPRHADAVRGKNVVLIDDVFTTGATVRECAQTLLNAGAARVDVVAVARVSRE